MKPKLFTLIITLQCFLGLCLNQFFAEQEAQQYCSQIPYNFATQCNITCQTCSAQSSQYAKCKACPDYFTLNNEYCETPTGQTYYYSQYFQGTVFENQEQFQKFYDQQGSLTISDTTNFCLGGKYRFQMVGPFDESTIIRFPASFQSQINQMSISFRVFFLVADAKITVRVDDQIIHNQTITTGLNLTNKLIEGNQTNYLLFISDPTDYIDKMFYQIKTSLITVQGFNFKVEMSLETQNGDVLIDGWYFSQFVITGIQCDTCISQSLIQFRQILGIIIGASAGTVILMLGLILIYLKIEKLRLSNRRKSQFLNKFKTLKNKTTKKLSFLQSNNNIQTQQKFIQQKKQ